MKNFGELYVKKAGEYVKIVFTCVIYFVEACYQLVFEAFEARHKINWGNIFIALVYQPIIVTLVSCFLVKFFDIEKWAMNGTTAYIGFAIFLGTIIMTIVLFLNSLVELIFRMINKGLYFTKIFALQNDVYNFVMAVISIAAIYAALDSYNAVLINKGLLYFGLLFFACLITNCMYNKIYLSREVVNRVYLQFKENVAADTR